MGEGQQASQILIQHYPDVQLRTHNDQVRTVTGVPMAEAATPALAASQWIENYAEVFGAEQPELQPVRVNQVGRGRFTVHAYQQTIDGIPVENGRLRLLVLNDALSSKVVYSTAKLASRPQSLNDPVVISGADAAAQIRQNPAYQTYTDWTEPEQVIYTDPDQTPAVEPVRTWKFMGSRPDPNDFESYTFFVDALTGELVHKRSEVYDINLSGTVSGWGSPGTLPDVSYNPPELFFLDGAKVSIVGGPSIFADADGNFLFENVTTPAPWTLRTELVGQWVNVQTIIGADVTAQQSVSSTSNPIELVFNTSPTEFVTSQVNGFVRVTGVHNFYKTYQPDYVGIDFPITCNVNLNDTCNAFFTSSFLTLFFFYEGNGCANTAYSSVIAHEYGHFIVHTLGLAQGAFGEGFSDSVAILMYDDPIIARDIRGPGTFIRDIVEANKKYPCGDGIHACGQVLAGLWWDIKENFQDSLGEDVGREAARQLFTDWSQITLGGLGSNAAHPLTVDEIFAVDDDDGDLFNGIPHYDEICDALRGRNLGCPGPPPVAFSFPDGRPDLVRPGEPTTFRVLIQPGFRTPAPNTGFVTYRTSQDPVLRNVHLDFTQPDEYQVTLPAVDCLETIEYYLSVVDTTGGRHFYPLDAPGRMLSALSATHVNYLVSDDFEQDRGWTVGDQDDNAVTGVWTRVDPVGSAAQPELDHTETPGTMCWVTGQNVAGQPPHQNDVDDGKTTLFSPVFDLSDGGGFISYWRWFSNSIGVNPREDVFMVDITNNGGLSWVKVDTVGPDGPLVTGNWSHRQFGVDDFLTPTASMQLRFIANDAQNPSVVEAAVDDFEAYRYECDATMDCNRNFQADPNDISFGVSEDCNNNQVPDECELASEAADDANNNGIPDGCECVEPCSDYNLCTVNDHCVNAVCVGQPMQCPERMRCNPLSGGCTDIQSDCRPMLGDVDHSGDIDLDDFICAVDAMQGAGDYLDCPLADVFPCEGDSIINDDDIDVLAQLFAGQEPCPNLPYGDVNHTHVIDIDDILCVLAGFGNIAACPWADIAPCEGNGIVDLDDVLTVLERFSLVGYL